MRVISPATLSYHRRVWPITGSTRHDRESIRRHGVQCQDGDSINDGDRDGDGDGDGGQHHERQRGVEYGCAVGSDSGARRGHRRRRGVSATAGLRPTPPRYVLHRRGGDGDVRCDRFLAGLSRSAFFGWRVCRPRSADSLGYPIGCGGLVFFPGYR